VHPSGVGEGGTQPAGSRDDLARAFVDLYPRCLRLATSLCGEPALAEDAVQDAFVALWQRPRLLDDPAASKAYVLRCVVNSVRSRQRREARGRELIEGTARVDVVEGVSGAAVDLQRALARLPERRRACVVLRYVLDLTEAEAARVLGVRTGTVKSQTHKALAQLRSDLAGLRTREGDRR